MTVDKVQTSLLPAQSVVLHVSYTKMAVTWLAILKSNANQLVPSAQLCRAIRVGMVYVQCILLCDCEKDDC